MIGEQGGRDGGAGCDGFDLRADISETTSSTLSAVVDGGRVRLGAGASFEDEFYTGMTLVTGWTSPQIATITKYDGGSRTAEVSPAFATAPSPGDAYGITAAPYRVLLDPPRSVNWVSKLVGKTSSALSCKCADGTGNSYTSMSAVVAVGCASGYKCSVTLASTAPAIDSLFVGETLHLAGTSTTAQILEYTGASRTAVLAVAGSASSVFQNQLGFTATVLDQTPYLLSAAHMVTVGDGDRNVSLAGAPYGIYLDDQSARVDAALSARQFFCDQLVGDNPPAAWIPQPMRKTFAFRSLPRIGGPATLTVAAEGKGFDDLLWRGNNITVTGEHGEFLGILFEDGEIDKSQQEGGPITDSITLSSEKMLEMTADKDVLFHFTTTGPMRDGHLRFRTMTLGFAPAAIFQQRVGVDEYLQEIMPRPDVGPTSADTDPSLAQHNMSVEFVLPAGNAGAPAGDAVFSVTVDGHLSQGFLEVSYANSALAQPHNFTMFRDWVWGEGSTSYGLSEPADVGVSCNSASVCSFNSAAEASNSRTQRHHASQRIPRAQIQRLVSEVVAASAGQRAVSEPRVRFLLQVRGTAAKISPLILSYPLARCYLHTLSASDSPSLGPSLSRPHKALIRFAGADAPAAVGDGTLWVSAEIQYHQQHVRDPLGLPGQRPRVLRTSAGEFYDAALRKVADPSAEILPTHHGTPALSAFAVHVGNMGELVDRLFLDDFSQYAPPFVDSIAIPKRLMEQLEEAKALEFTIDIPPGIGAVRIFSAVIAYPTL